MQQGILAVALLMLIGVARGETTPAVIWLPSETVTVQGIVNSLPAGGGEIKLGCGTFNGPKIALPDFVRLVGSGSCTRIPPVISLNNTPGATVQHNQGIVVENLRIDGSLSDGYVGVDFKNVLLGKIRDVTIENVDVGVAVYGVSGYWNVVEDVTVDAREECFRIMNGANEVTLRGGKCQSAVSPNRHGKGVFIQDVNNTKVFGTNFENVEAGVVLGVGALNTVITGIRLENNSCGYWVESQSQKTQVFGSYESDVSKTFCKRSGVVIDALDFVFELNPHARYIGFGFTSCIIGTDCPAVSGLQ